MPRVRSNHIWRFLCWCFSLFSCVLCATIFTYIQSLYASCSGCCRYAEWQIHPCTGNDALVLMGLHYSLGRNVVQVLEFEYNEQGKWADIRLSFILDFLDHHAFECFWQGDKGQLWRLSGCWDESYQQNKQWSNVVCAHRKSKAFNEFVDHSSKYM